MSKSHAIRIDPHHSTLSLKFGEKLDLAVIDLIVVALNIMNGRPLSRVVVDFADTRKIFDSGLAMLFLLQQRASHLKDAIFLKQTSRPVRERIRSSELTASLQFINCSDCPRRTTQNLQPIPSDCQACAVNRGTGKVDQKPPQMPEPDPAGKSSG